MSWGKNMHYSDWLAMLGYCGVSLVYSVTFTFLIGGYFWSPKMMQHFILVITHQCMHTNATILAFSVVYWSIFWCLYCLYFCNVSILHQGNLQLEVIKWSTFWLRRKMFKLKKCPKTVNNWGRDDILVYYSDWPAWLAVVVEWYPSNLYTKKIGQ